MLQNKWTVGPCMFYLDIKFLMKIDGLYDREPRDVFMLLVEVLFKLVIRDLGMIDCLQGINVFVLVRHDRITVRVVINVGVIIIMVRGPPCIRVLCQPSAGKYVVLVILCT